MFAQLAKEAKGREGKEFDEFMGNLFCQFQAVLALEIRAVRMLRSFLAYSQEDLTYGRDVQGIFEDLAIQRQEYDPVEIFHWYLDFMRQGGKFNMKALKPDSYLYMEYGNHRVSGWGSYPGPKGEFQIEPYVGGSFFVSCKYYPGEFMQLREDADDADVKSTKNDKDLQCHWFFHVVDIATKGFRLSTAKWPSRYVYMQDDIYTEIRGCDDVKRRDLQTQFRLIAIA